jgi:hypothetical protein
MHKHHYKLIGALKRPKKARRYKFACNGCGYFNTIEKTAYQIWHPEKMVEFNERNIERLMTQYETLYTLEEFLDMLKKHRTMGRTTFFLRIERGLDGVWRQVGEPTEQEMMEWVG